MTQGKSLTTALYVKHHLNHWQLSLGEGSFWKLHIDTLLVSTLLGFLFLTLMFTSARKSTAGIPGNLQNAIESVCELIDTTVADVYLYKRNFITPLAITIFVWVLLMNFMDLIPVDLVGWLIVNLAGSQNSHFRLVPTADSNLTFGLSITVFLMVIYYNFSAKGFRGVLKEILSVPFGIMLFPLNVIFRLIDEVVKPLSLALRLYGNLFAGELIFLLIASLPWFIQWTLGGLWAIFHIMVIVIQAFVFMMLTVVYLHQAQDKH